MSIAQNFSAQDIPFPFEGGTKAAKINIVGNTPPPIGPGYAPAFNIPITAAPGYYMLVGQINLTHGVPIGQWIGMVIQNGAPIIVKTTVISDGGGQASLCFTAPFTWTGSASTLQVQLGCQSGFVIFSELTAVNMKTI